jgi:hypothetical protein
MKDVGIYILFGHLVNLRPFGIFCGHLKYFMLIWYISPCFGMLHLEKPGNPDLIHIE